MGALIAFHFLQLILLTSSCTLTISPSEIEVNPGKWASTNVSCGDGAGVITVQSSDSSIAKLNATSLTLDSESLRSFMYADEVGIAYLTYTVVGSNPTLSQRIKVRVVRPTTRAGQVFNLILAMMVVINALNLGCTMDLKLIFSHMKSPKKIGIGLFSQFVFMPLIALFLCKIFQFSSSLAVGTIIMGAAPGGGASNWVAFMLDGDLELSIVMTFCSTVLAIGMMPLWLVILTRDYTDDDLSIPYPQIAIALLGIIGPTFVGLFFQKKIPKLAKFFASIIPVFGFVAVSMAIGTGAYSNQYLFFYPYKPWLVGFLLPFFGFLTGFSFSSLLRMELKHRVTISVETGIQNSILAIAIAEIAFDKPQSDEVVAVPLYAALLAGSQTISAIIIYTIYKRRFAGKFGPEPLTKNDRISTEPEGTADVRLDYQTLTEERDDDERENGSHSETIDEESSQKVTNGRKISKKKPRISDANK